MLLSLLCFRVVVVVVVVGVAVVTPFQIAVYNEKQLEVKKWCEKIHKVKSLAKSEVGCYISKTDNIAYQLDHHQKAW